MNIFANAANIGKWGVENQREISGWRSALPAPPGQMRLVFLTAETILYTCFILCILGLTLTTWAVAGLPHRSRLVSSGEHGGIAPTHCSPLNGLSLVELYPFCAFELAVASCTPLVPLNGLSPVVPRSWLNFHLTSPVLPLTEGGWAGRKLTTAL